MAELSCIDNEYSREYLIISSEARNCIINKQNDEAKRLLPKENLNKYFDSSSLPLLHLAVTHKNSEMTQYLIDNGCDINSGDRYTPLIVAISTKCVETIHILIDAHCKQNIRGKYLKNIIQYHTYDPTDEYFYVEKQRIFEICLKRIKDNFGSNEEDMYDALFRANCQLHKIVRSMKDAKATKYFLDRDYNVDLCEPITNLSLINIAVQVQNFDNIKVLLEYGADTRSISIFSTAFIAKCIYNNNHDCSEILKICYLLLQHGADIGFASKFVAQYFRNIDKSDTPNLVTVKLQAAQVVLDVSRGHEISHFARKWIDFWISRPPRAEIMQKYYTLCKQQINQMKQLIFYESITLFDVLSASKDKLMVYVKKNNFVSNFENTIDKMFDVDSYYYGALKIRISTALTLVQMKANLKRKLCVIISEITGFRYSSYHMIVDRIVDFLDKNDVQRVLRI